MDAQVVAALEQTLNQDPNLRKPAEQFLRTNEQVSRRPASTSRSVAAADGWILLNSAGSFIQQRRGRATAAAGGHISQEQRGPLLGPPRPGPDPSGPG